MIRQVTFGFLISMMSSCCNGKGQSRFSCSIGFLVAWDVYMTWDPTKDDRFPIVGEICIVFDYFLYEVELEFIPIQGFKARICGNTIQDLPSETVLKFSQVQHNYTRCTVQPVSFTPNSQKPVFQCLFKYLTVTITTRVVQCGV